MSSNFNISIKFSSDFFLRILNSYWFFKILTIINNFKLFWKYQIIITLLKLLLTKASAPGPSAPTSLISLSLNPQGLAIPLKQAIAIYPKAELQRIFWVHRLAQEISLLKTWKT